MIVYNLLEFLFLTTPGFEPEHELATFFPLQDDFSLNKVKTKWKKFMQIRTDQITWME